MCFKNIKLGARLTCTGSGCHQYDSDQSSKGMHCGIRMKGLGMIRLENWAIFERENMEVNDRHQVRKVCGVNDRHQVKERSERNSCGDED